MTGLPASVLFACSENSVRSPTAEALAKRLYGQSSYIDSVGVRASEVDGFAVAVLDEMGIDVHRHHAKTFEDVDPASFDLIVTLSPEAHHRALEFTRGTATEAEYWPMPDPSAWEGSRDSRLDAYRPTRAPVLARLTPRLGVSLAPPL
ncbi:MAG: low molecular weight phosphatase family protein [Reyranella sp.]|nr:low molecular weight phosphatase family protein [Reyranella sp.]